jgi:deoxycytidine triphosphate deaminase
MTTLSNVDIEKELGKNILIFPFYKGNLKCASYNLTASWLAWNISNGESCYDNFKKKVVIPGRATVLVETNETIWVSSEISGTYHSKVYMVSKGLGHIGTTLDPDYIGPSLIAVHNHSDHEIELTPEIDSFVSIVFRYVKTKSSVAHDNDPGRQDILRRNFGTTKLNISDTENDWLNQDFRKYKKSLKERLEQEPDNSDYKRIIKARKSRTSWYLGFIPYIIFSLVIISSLSWGAYLYANQTNLKSKYSWYTAATFLTDKIATGFIGALVVQFINDLQRKNKGS